MKLEKINPELFAKIFKEKIKEDLDFNEPLCEQLDELDYIEIIMEIEKRLDIAISDDDLEKNSNKSPNEIFVQIIRDKKLNKILDLEN
jgi:acyl carrier protein